MIKMLQYKMYPAGELAVLRQLLFFFVSLSAKFVYLIDSRLFIYLHVCLQKMYIALFSDCSVVILNSPQRTSRTVLSILGADSESVRGVNSQFHFQRKF